MRKQVGERSDTGFPGPALRSHLLCEDIISHRLWGSAPPWRKVGDVLTFWCGELQYGIFALWATYFARVGKVGKTPPGFEWMRLVASRLHLKHSAPRTPERTAALRKAFLASGAMVTGLCKHRLGCRPAQFNRSFLLPNKAPVAVGISFPL